MTSEEQDTSQTEGATGRSIVVDETQFEEQFLRCQVCREKFQTEERPPKSLPCNHTFCLPCLKQVFDHGQPTARRTLLWSEEAHDGSLKCPQCRVEIYLSRGEIKKLPNDHRIIQMIDFFSQAVVKAKNICNKHDGQSLNFFCKMCLVPVCRDCTVLDHKEPQGHVIVDVAEALSESSEEFNDIESKSKSILERMKARSESLANASKRLDIQERKLRSQIKDTFIEYRLLLERRQEALINILEEDIAKQKNLINAKFYDVTSNVNELRELYESFTQARESNNIQQLFTLNEKMKEKEQSLSDAANTDDNNLFIAATFAVESEGNFLSEMSGLGEIGQHEDLQLKEPVPAHQLYMYDIEERQERLRQLQQTMTDCDEYASNVMEQMDDDEDLESLDIEAITHRLLGTRTTPRESEVQEDSPPRNQSRRGRRQEEMYVPPVAPVRQPGGSRRPGPRSRRRPPEIQIYRHEGYERPGENSAN